ncbi:MAG TPA: peptidase M22 [Opitutaceae bacterium]
MPALVDILAHHVPLLLIDSASARVQVGLFGPDNFVQWTAADDEAGAAIFHCVEKLGVQLGSVAAFAFCEGPGSVLGIRTAAAALRTWNVLKSRPVFAFHSLAIVAQALAQPGLTVIADARRDSWHAVTVASDGQPGPLQRLPTAELPGELVTPAGFRAWSKLARPCRTTAYDLAALLALPRVAQADLFRATTDPDAFMHEEPSYVTWTPRIHRAPTPPASSASSS